MNQYIKICNHSSKAANFDSEFNFIGINADTIKGAIEGSELIYPQFVHTAPDEKSKLFCSQYTDTIDTRLWFVHLDIDEFADLFHDWQNKIVCRFSYGGDLTSSSELVAWENENCDLNFANCRGAKNDKSFFIVHVLNYQPIKGEFDQIKVHRLAALCRLTYCDAQYILSCATPDGKTPLRVDFSRNNAESGKHSAHSTEDYESLNLLFNKPADSDTLVAWYMLAQAHDLCGVDEQKNELRQDKAAWQINGSWSDKAAELIANDFDYTVSSWGLELAEKEEEKEEIRRKLQEFARVVYGTDEISAENVKNVLEALKKIFARAEEKAK